jgi:tRNA A37 threonylcarbamoyladenosine dehydratase
MRFQRVKDLFQDKFKDIQKASVVIIGVGGVGGYVLDCLYRSGVKTITIIDFDKFELSNQNRQIGSEYIGQYKVDVLKQLYPNIKTINTKITPKWVEQNLLDEYDIIIDAIDDIPSKVALIKKYHKKLISSVGSAKRIDPSKISYTNIWDTYNDTFAKKLRYELKKAGFNKKFKVVFSDELPQNKSLGSFVAVSGSFGFMICSIAIRKITKLL